MTETVKIDRPQRRNLEARFAQTLRELLPDFRISVPREAARKAWGATLTVRSGRRTSQLLIEYKSVGEPRYLAQAITVLTLAARRQPRSYPLIVAPYIGPEGQRLCREAGVGYVDSSGNAFLRFDGVLVDRQSATRPPRAKARLRRLFAPRSSRIVRVLLSTPETTWTLSRLAAEASVSVRTAHLVINALEEQAFVDKRRGAIRVAKPGALLDLWAENYRIDQHRRQTFYSFIRDPRELATKLADEARAQNVKLGLTLHAGASLVAAFVRYTDVHAYVAGDIDRLVKALDFRPVESGGGVHLLTPNDEGVFYGTRTIEGVPAVSDVQLYLDLIHYPARGREQAEELRRRKLQY